MGLWVNANYGIHYQDFCREHMTQSIGAAINICNLRPMLAQEADLRNKKK